MKKIISVIFIIASLLSFSSYGLIKEKNQSVEECVDLKCIRSNIDEIDKKIIILLSNRMKFVIQAGKIKLKNNIATADDKLRVSQVINQSEKFGNENGLPSGFTKEVFQVIVDKSVFYEQNDMNKRKIKD